MVRPPAAPRWFTAFRRRSLQPAGRSTPLERLQAPEVLVGFLLLGFVLLSLAEHGSGHPQSRESIQYSAAYAFIWLLWLATVAFLVPPSWRWLQILRGFGPWLAVMQAYNLMRVLIPAVHPVQMDALLRRVETEWMSGSIPWARALEGHPRWTDLFCAIYLALFLWMAFYAAYYVLARRDLLQRFMTGFVVIYAGGFAGYLLCPATGPRYAYAGEWGWLSGGVIFALSNRVIGGMGARFDAFPSLHAALSLYLLSWQAGHRPRHLVWGLPLAAGIWASTLLLGFHYLPDLAAGGLLALAALFAARGHREGTGTRGPAGPRQRLEHAFFHFSSVVTDRWPRRGAWFLDQVVLPVYRSTYLIARARRRNRRIVARVKTAGRILVVSDMHIGDAVYTQVAVTALRDFFPDARIDYAVHHLVAPLIEGNPEIDRVLPLFTGSALPSRPDLDSLGLLLKEDGHDFYLNFSPFFVGAGACRTGRPLLDIHSHGHELARNELYTDVPNHFLYQMDFFVRSLLEERFAIRRPATAPRVAVYLRGAARLEAEAWLSSTGWRAPAPLVFLNPDAASPYARIPETVQVDLLQRIGRQGAFLLIGEGITFSGIGHRLQKALPRRLAAASAVVPARFRLELYAALTDCCHLFISGDTGPLHIAAARKRTKDAPERFVNRTAVFSIFGATPPRMSGYDDRRPGFLPANQDAPSATFISESPCRNLTCAHKMLKRCRQPRCFERLDTHAIAERARGILAGIDATERRSPPLSREAAGD